MSELLYTDPNCTQSERWTAWREAIRRGGVALDPWSADEVASRGIDAAAEALKLGISEHEAGLCFLGAAALLLAQVVSAWRGGRFFVSLQLFTVLHDQFLTNVHPFFPEQSAWPLRDKDIRAWKDRFLYQVRRFRELAGRRLDQGMAGFDAEAIEDSVERENLGFFASHVFRQQEQQASRGDDQANAWEMSAVQAVVPSLSAVRLPFRVYVYDEPSIPALGPLTRAPAFCHYRQWGMDVGFHDFFRSSPLRTFDPDEADFFFVPSYACCHQVANLLDFPELDTAHIEAVRQLPYFGRSGGRDHIFSFHYVDLFPGWRRHIPRSIFLTPETEVGFERSREDFELDVASFPPFDPLKDFSVPPYINMRDILGFHGHSRPIAEREHLGVFAGKLWRDIEEASDIRGRLAALAGQPGLVIHAYGSIAQQYGPDGMQRLMGNARFCFCPRGRAAWSVRFFEALWAGCVPVLLSDHYEPPFSTLFDVSEFVIKWPMARIDASLLEYLRSIPVDVVERYADVARRVRCWYLYPPPEVSWLGSWEARNELERVEKEICPNLSSSRNAFQAVAELLRRRVRRTRASGDSATFYMPDPQRGHASTVMDAELTPL